MQSSSNTIFSGNSCTGGHSVSIGTRRCHCGVHRHGLSPYRQENKIINSDNGIRIKTIQGLKGMVFNATYTGNVLTNVKNAIVIHSDYSKAKGGYTGSATCLVTIKGIMIDGLSSTATNKWDIVANSKVVSGWKFSGITVKASKKGSCSGLPSGVACS